MFMPKDTRYGCVASLPEDRKFSAFGHQFNHQLLKEHNLGRVKDHFHEQICAMTAEDAGRQYAEMVISLHAHGDLDYYMDLLRARDAMDIAKMKAGIE